MVNQETQVANVANTIIAMSQALDGIRKQINDASTQWTNLSAATKLAAFPTAPLTTTGGLGTLDGASVTTNPIDTRTVIGGQVSRAISSNTIAGLLTYLQGVSTAIGGGAISANGAAAQQVAQTL